MSLIAVTGGTGTRGQNLVSAALARGHEVRVISRRAGASVADGARHAVADVLTGEGLDHALDGAEVVIHAATSPLRRSRATEAEGTRGVVRSAERAAAHLIYVSIVVWTATAFPTTVRNWRPSRSLRRPKPPGRSTGPPSSTNSWTGRWALRSSL